MTDFAFLKELDEMRSRVEPIADLSDVFYSLRGLDPNTKPWQLVRVRAQASGSIPWQTLNIDRSGCFDFRPGFPKPKVSAPSGHSLPPAKPANPAPVVASGQFSAGRLSYTGGHFWVKAGLGVHGHDRTDFLPSNTPEIQDSVELEVTWVAGITPISDMVVHFAMSPAHDLAMKCVTIGDPCSVDAYGTLQVRTTTPGVGSVQEQVDLTVSRPNVLQPTQKKEVRLWQAKLPGTVVLGEVEESMKKETLPQRFSVEASYSFSGKTNQTYGIVYTEVFSVVANGPHGCAAEVHQTSTPQLIYTM